MAKETIDVNISIEKTIHKGLREIIQGIWDEHQIRINAIDIDWSDFSDMSQMSFRVNTLKMDSVTYPEWKS